MQPEENDYSRRRELNIGSKYRVLHGNTYDSREFLTLSGLSLQEISEKTTRNTRVMDEVIYEELLSIIPKSQLPAEN